MLSLTGIYIMFRMSKIGYLHFKHRCFLDIRTMPLESILYRIHTDIVSPALSKQVKL